MPQSARPGDLLADRYVLVDLLSEHAGAGFWRAHDQVLDRAVAVHVLAVGDRRAPVLLEAARRSATVADQHVLRVLDAATTPTLAYVVNEWGWGTSLDIMLGHEGPLEPGTAAWVVSEVASCLVAAHRAGVHHGRLNPENVLIERQGGVRVIGLAVDAALHGLTLDRPQDDIADLAGLLYAGLTARWAGVSESRLAPAPRDRGRVLRARQVRAGLSRSLDQLVSDLLNPQPGFGGRAGAIDAAGVVTRLEEHCDPVRVARAELSGRQVAAPVRRPGTVPPPSSTLPTPAPPTPAPPTPAPPTPAPPTAPVVDPVPAVEPAPALPVQNAEPTQVVPAAVQPAPVPPPAPQPEPEPAPEHASESAAPGPDADATQVGLTGEETLAVALPPEAGSVRRSRPAPPPPPDLPPAAERPLFAPEPTDGRPVRTPRAGAGPGPRGDDYWPWGETTGSGVMPAFVEEQPAAPTSVPGRTALRLAGVLIAVLVLLLTILVVFNLGRGRTPLGALPEGETTTSTTGQATPTTPASPLPDLRASDLDPQGDPPSENPEQTRFAVDGDPATAWTTLTYVQDFGPGGLKSGLGLVLDLGGSATVREVDVDALGGPTGVSIYVTDTRPTSVDGLVPAQEATVEQRSKVVLSTPTTGRYVVLWITHLPQVPGGFQAAIAEVRVLA